jgi:hypothetical protein
VVLQARGRRAPTEGKSSMALGLDNNLRRWRIQEAAGTTLLCLF